MALFAHRAGISGSLCGQLPQGRGEAPRLCGVPTTPCTSVVDEGNPRL